VASPMLVIGVGNALRADDAAGLRVARGLRPGPGVDVCEQSGEATALLEALRGSAAAVIVDAALGAQPGRVHRLDAAAGPLPQGLFGFSTHGFGVAEGIELARALGALPPVCVVYAVEGERFETGAPMSAAVTRALPRLAEGITREIEAVRQAQTRQA